MIPDLEIYRTADLFVKHHREGAPVEATVLAKGDLDGYAVWKRILRAVEGLQETAPRSGEAVH